MAKSPRTVVWEDPDKKTVDDNKRVIRSQYTRNGKFPKRNKDMPQARTVGQLMEILAQLPKGLPLRHEADHAVQPVWYNVGLSDEHLAFDEGKEIEE